MRRFIVYWIQWFPSSQARAIKTEGGRKNLETNYAIEMLNITKRFPGIIANDNITLRLKKGEIHALLGENGAGKSTLMSVLFGLYQPEEGEIHKDGRKVEIRDPNDANALGIGMVHQHFKLVECFSVLDNIILGVEPNKMGFLQKQDARKKVLDLSEKYGLHVDPDAIIEDITVGMQQRTEILKMLYRDNEILIFDEPTAVLTPQEIEELMQIMKNLAAEGKSILFISHKLNEIMEVSDRVTVLRKGKCIGTVETANTTAEELSAMMVGRNVSFHVEKGPLKPGGEVLSVEHLTVASKVHKNNAVKDVSFRVRAGEIVCIAGIDGNGQTELVYALTGLEPAVSGKITLEGKDITHASIRQRSLMGMSHIPEDRHKHGLVLDYTLEDNMVLQRYFEPEFTDKAGFLRRKNIRAYAEGLIEQYDVRAGRARSHRRAVCPAATSRRPSLPARSTSTPSCSSPCSPRAVWTSARSSTSTSSLSPSATRARPCCSSRWSWTRSWTCRTAFSSCTRARSSASWIPSPPRRRSLASTWRAPREMR